MGVPKLFRTLTQKYKDIIVSDGGRTSTHVFFDLNCLIHPVCADCENNIDKMFQAIKDYIKKVVDHVNPQAKVFLFMDGVAPFAKIQQQRQRRYKSLYLKKKRQQVTSELLGGDGIESESEGNDYWDSNIISPGTYFMLELEKFLVREFPGYTVSGTGEPGEGEHKIVEYILSHRLFFKTPDVKRSEPLTTLTHQESSDICIYGLDADLILLSWVICLKTKMNVLLIREVQHMLNKKTNAKVSPKAKAKTSDSAKVFTFLNINRLMNSYYRDLNLFINREQECCDFILLSFFLGNDFLPNMFGIQLGTKPDGLTVLLQNYKHCKKTYDNFYLVSRSVVSGPTHAAKNISTEGLPCEINWYGLYLFFGALLKQTDEINANFLKWYLNFCPRPSDNDDQADQAMWKFENGHEKQDPVRICTDGWQERYCKRYLDCNRQQPDSMYVTANYICGLLWNLKYYFKTEQQLSFGYVYPFSASPTIEMTHHFLESQTQALERKPTGANYYVPSIWEFYKLYVLSSLCPVSPLDPQTALFIIMPPESYHRVSTRKVLSSEASKELSKRLLSTNFRMDYKHYWNECSLDLPPIEWALSFDAANKVVTGKT